MDRFRLPLEIQARILDYVQATPAVEVCGLLGGRPAEASSWHPVANVANHPARRFRMDPRGQIDAFRVLREADEALCAIVHSHPDAPAVPSLTDRDELSYPEAALIIVSLQNPDAPELRAWRWNGEAFRELELVVK